MREESHLDDMRDAIRGDFERLAERRGDQELMRPTEPDETPVEAEGPVATGLVTSEIEPEHDPEAEPEVVERRSWVARLFST